MHPKRLIAIIAGSASGVGLVCWLIMFMAGTDVWHDVGRPDFWKLTGPPYSDLRVFAWSFYAQFFVLLIGLVASAFVALRAASARERRSAAG